MFFHTFRADSDALASSVHAPAMTGRKGKINNRGALKRSAGSWLPEAGCPSTWGLCSERQCGLPASRWPHALWPFFAAAVTSVRITKLLLSLHCIRHLELLQIVYPLLKNNCFVILPDKHSPPPHKRPGPSRWLWPGGRRGIHSRFFWHERRHFIHSQLLSSKCIHETFQWSEEMWHLTV